MKRIIKSAEEKFEEMKESVNGLEFNGGLVEYDIENGKSIVYLDENQEVRTYNKVPYDFDFQTLAEGISYNSSSSNITLDDFISFYSDPAGVFDSELHEAWVDYLKDGDNHLDSDFIGPEYEEFDEQKLFDEFAKRIEGKNLDQINEDCDVYEIDECGSYRLYRVHDDEFAKGVGFEIKVSKINGEVIVIPEIGIEDLEHHYDYYRVEDRKEVVTYSGERNFIEDESVLSLDEEQKIALELLKLAFKKAKESKLRIFHTPELGTYCYNGNKLQVDGISTYDDSKNFLFKEDSKLKVDFSDLDDVFNYWFGDERQGFGLLVAES